MNYPLFMGYGEGREALGCNRQEFIESKWATWRTGRSPFIDKASQCFTLDVFHYDEHVVADVDDIVHAGNVLVLQSDGPACFLEKGPSKFGIASVFSIGALESKRRVERDVIGQLHFGLRAAAQAIANLVLSRYGCSDEIVLFVNKRLGGQRKHCCRSQTVRGGPMFQQGSNLLPDIGPAPIFTLQKRRYRILRQRRRLHVCILDFDPQFRIHRWMLPSSRINQTFANSKSRCTVDVPMPIVLAISSTVIPSKNQS